jgi:tRNA pseudouridine13 synthase
MESAVAKRHPALCDGLDHAGLKQERRAVRVIPGNLSWQWQESDIILSFELSRGAYATSLLREIIMWSNSSAA